MVNDDDDVKNETCPHILSARCFGFTQPSFFLFTSFFARTKNSQERQVVVCSGAS